MLSASNVSLVADSQNFRPSRSDILRKGAAAGAIVAMTSGVAVPPSATAQPGMCASYEPSGSVLQIFLMVLLFTSPFETAASQLPGL